MVASPRALIATLRQIVVLSSADNLLLLVIPEKSPSPADVHVSVSFNARPMLYPVIGFENRSYRNQKACRQVEAGIASAIPQIGDDLLHRRSRPSRANELNRSRGRVLGCSRSRLIEVADGCVLS